MKYVLIGKQCAYLDTIKERISREDKEILCLNKPTILLNEESKIIYIKASIPYSWEYWMGSDINNEDNLKRFVDEVMDFRELDEEKCHLILDYNGTSLLSITEKIREFIDQCESESENQ